MRLVIACLRSFRASEHVCRVFCAAKSKKVLREREREIPVMVFSIETTVYTVIEKKCNVSLQYSNDVVYMHIHVHVI